MYVLNHCNEMDVVKMTNHLRISFFATTSPDRRYVFDTLRTRDLQISYFMKVHIFDYGLCT